jgi:hypothetical protein
VWPFWGHKRRKKRKENKKMDRFRRLPKSLLESISPRGQTSSPQTPPPQEAPKPSSTSKKDAAARNAAIAGAIGAGISFLGTQDDNRLESGQSVMSTAERAANAAGMAAMFAGAAGTFTASEGSVLTRALKAGAGGLIAGNVVGRPAFFAARKMQFGRPYV